MARFYAAILFLVSAFVSNANAEQTKDGLLRGNNSGEVTEQNMVDFELGDRRLQVSRVTFEEFSFNVPMKDMSVNKDGTSGWGIGRDDSKTYTFECRDPNNCPKQDWEVPNESNGDMSRLLADSISYSGNGKHEWAVADGNDLYRGHTVDTWMYRDKPRASFLQISVSFCGKYVYAVDTDGTVWYKEVVGTQNGKREPAWTTVSGGNRDGYSYVAVDEGDFVWGIAVGTRSIWKYDVNRRTWSQFDVLQSNPKTISVDKSSTNVWVVDDKNALWYSNGSSRFAPVTISSGQTISMATSSGDGKKLFALRADRFEGDTLVADIDTRTFSTSAVDEDEDEGFGHPEDNSEASFATVKGS